MNKETLKYSFLASLPVMAGYIVLGIGFGLMMYDKGYSFWWCILMSVTIYGGSMQYVGVSLLSGGASLITTAITSLMVQARHLFYGISMLEKYKGTGWKKFYLIFGMCDESFSINYTAEVPEGVDRGWFMFFVTLLNQCYWVSGAALGGLLGSFIPFDTEGLDFVMTALFVVIFLDQWLKEKKHYTALIGLGASAACLLIFGADGFMIPTMVCIICLLTVFRRPIEKAGGLE